MLDRDALSPAGGRPESAAGASPPSRPSPGRERLSHALFRSFAPRLRRIERAPPPPELGPFESVALPRQRGASLAAFRFPAAGPMRGVVLFLHPWLEWGAAYFFRRRRIQAVTQAGFEAVVPDLGGFGDSPRGRGFLDRDVADALAAVRHRHPGQPLCVWGVSAGGYWTHLALSGRACAPGGTRARAQALFFEDVSAHLMEWSWRQAPQWRVGYLAFRALFPDVDRWLDLRRHAGHLGAATVSYVSGERDSGVRVEETRELASAARGESLIVAGAGHLEAIKRQPEAVIARALATFTGA